LFHPRLYRRNADLTDLARPVIVVKQDDHSGPPFLFYQPPPNAVIDPQFPVPDWPLSDQGRSQMRLGLKQPWVPDLSAIYCSTEQKAIDSAEILANATALPFTQIHDLGENDRSPTGFLPPAEFEHVADPFFAPPAQSVRGWETANDAQSRIVKAISAIVESDETHGSVAIVSHRAVGTLLSCYLAQKSISRDSDQPPNGGGNYYAFTMNPRQSFSWWQPIDSADLSPA